VEGGIRHAAGEGGKTAAHGEKLREQLGRLGGTPFKLGELKNFLSGEVMLPVSELNRLRREFVGELEKLRAQPKRWTLERPRPEPGSRKWNGATVRKSGNRGPQLIVLVRNLPQLEAALKCGVQTVYCEFEDPKNIARP
jgi:U32 family peptidase